MLDAHVYVTQAQYLYEYVSAIILFIIIILLLLFNNIVVSDVPKWYELTLLGQNEKIESKMVSLSHSRTSRGIAIHKSTYSHTRNKPTHLSRYETVIFYLFSSIFISCSNPQNISFLYNLSWLVVNNLSLTIVVSK